MNGNVRVTFGKCTANATNLPLIAVTLFGFVHIVNKNDNNSPVDSRDC